VAVLSAVPRADFAPFDALAEVYDEVFTHTPVGRAQREIVQLEMNRSFRQGQRILEINCGTGADAIYLASRGLRVVACDESPEMIRIARLRAKETGTEKQIEFMVLKIESVSSLAQGKPFDGLLSNFGGLNCVQDLAATAHDLALVLKPGAKALLNVFSRFCAWETFWYLLHRNSRNAFRRFRSEITAGLANGVSVRIYYHSLRRFKQDLSPYFRIKKRRGVGIVVPPSYLNDYAVRFVPFLNFAKGFDRAVCGLPMFRSVADHTLMVFERSFVNVQ